MLQFSVVEFFFVILNMSSITKIRRSKRVSSKEKIVKNEERPVETSDLPLTTNTTTSKSTDINI